MICLFEDSRARYFSPVADTRHVSHLLVGTRTLRQRAVDSLDDSHVVLHGRRYILDYYRASGEYVDPPEEDTYFVNARLLLTREIAGSFPRGEEWTLWKGSDLVAARLRRETIRRLDWDAEVLDFGLLSGIERHDDEKLELYGYLWDLVYDNPARITDDARAATLLREGVVMSGAHLVNPGSISIGPGSTIKPGGVLDATGGPIVIGDNVEVMPNAVLEGPCFVGRDCRIKIGAKIYGGTSIGPWCKVGGEVENSIFLGYSNKQHDGFLGHSYLGRWVNLGADTNTSDLKNNYGTIRVTISGEEVNTGRMFLGTLFGDHAKTGINTMLNTGTVVGIAANIFGGGFPQKSIPAFAWGGYGEAERFRLEDALELARRVMARRGVELTNADETLLRYLSASAR